MRESADAPEGWYVEGNEELFWDGSQWTGETRPLAPAEGGPQPVAAGAPQPVAAAVGPQPVPAGGPQPVSDAPAGGGIVYKVLTQKDRFFGGKFDPQKLESALNSYAEQGWRVVGVATADIPSFGSARQELVVVMSRDR
jgi:hypothetical protein